MRSIRIDDELDQRLRQAADREGVSVSQFIRAAVTERSERVLGQDPLAQLRHFIGVGRSGQAGLSHRTGSAFADLVVDKHEAETRRRRRQQTRGA